MSQWTNDNSIHYTLCHNEQVISPFTTHYVTMNKWYHHSLHIMSQWTSDIHHSLHIMSQWTNDNSIHYTLCHNEQVISTIHYTLCHNEQMITPFTTHYVTMNKWYPPFTTHYVTMNNEQVISHEAVLRKSSLLYSPIYSPDCMSRTAARSATSVWSSSSFASPTANSKIGSTRSPRPPLVAGNVVNLTYSDCDEIQLVSNLWS